MAETATHRSGGPKRPLLRIADIFRRHRKALEAKHVLNFGQRRLLGAIVACRTPALGAQLHVCRICQAVHPVYLSCRKRGCPNCQALAQEQWIAQRRERVLPVRHFHLVFTLPSELRWLAMNHPGLLCGAFFRIVGAILEELGRDHLKATLGWTMVLHTWRRDLGPHIHIHVLVTAGGLLLDGSAFRHVAGLYLFSGEAMGILLRGKVLDALRAEQAAGSFPELDDRALNELMAGLARHPSWVVHAEPPFRDPTHLLNDLGRYVLRIALSDSRLVEAGPERVTFTTRDGNTASMDPVRFMHRFLQHVLPRGFHKVRHGGLHASTRKGGRLDQAGALLEQEVDPEEAAKWQRGTAETMAKLVFSLPGLRRGHGADQRADPGPARASWRMRCLTSLKRIHRSKRLDPGPASRWPHGWRLPRNDEGDMPFRPGPPVRGQAAGPVKCQGLNSGLDFSIGVIWHSPHRR